jgi:hypothetical protein
MASVYNSGAPFDPATFLYLNPELQAWSNVGSIEDARDYYAANSNAGDWLWSLSYIPDRFDDIIYLADNRESINISGLNKTIRQAMLNDGWTSKDILQNGMYVPTVFRDIHLLSNNVFRFNYGASSNLFYANLSNLNVGDQLRIVRNGTENLYGFVANILPDKETFVLSNDHFVFSDLASSYELYGIKVFDIERIAKINYLKYLSQCNVPQPSFTLFGSDFNATLYKILYPEARIFDDETAFIDYTSHLDNNELRIGRTADLITTLDPSFTTTFQDLTVKNRLYLDLQAQNGFVNWNGLELYYTTTNSYRTAAETDQAFQGLITEYAIKSYVDRKYLIEAIFNNIIVNGTTTLNGATTTNSLFQANGASTFNNQVTFNSNVDFMSPASYNEAVTFNHLTTFNDPVEMNDMVSVNSQLLLNGNTDVYGDITIHAPLTVLDDVNTYGPITNYNSNSFKGVTTFDSNVVFNAWTVFQGTETDFHNTVTFHDAVTGLSNMTWMGEVSFCNQVTFDSSILANAAAVFTSDIISLSNSYFVGKPTFCNLVTFASNVYYESQTDTLIDGTLRIGTDGEIYVSGAFYAEGSNVFLSGVTHCNDVMFMSSVTLSNEISNPDAMLNVYIPTVFYDDVSFSNPVMFNEPVSLGSNALLTSSGPAVFESNVDFMDTVYFHEQTFFLSNITLCNHADFQSTASFSAPVSFGSNVSFLEDATFSKSVTFAEDVVFTNPLLITVPVTSTEEVFFLSNTFAKGSFFFESNATFCNEAIFAGPARFLDNAVFVQPVTFCNVVDFETDVNFNGPLNITDTLRISGSLVIDSNATFVCESPITFSNQVTTLNLETIDTYALNIAVSNLVCSKTSIFTGSNVFTGPTSFTVIEGPSFQVNTNATFSCNVYLPTSLLIASNCLIQHAFALQMEASNATIHTLTVDSNLFLTGKTTVDGLSIFNGHVNFCNNTYIGAVATFTGETIARGPVYLEDDTYINNARVSNLEVENGSFQELRVDNLFAQRSYLESNWTLDSYSSNATMNVASFNAAFANDINMSNAYALDAEVDNLVVHWSSNDGQTFMMSSHTLSNWTLVSFTSNAFVDSFEASNVSIESAFVKSARVAELGASNAYIKSLSNDIGAFSVAYTSSNWVRELFNSNAYIQHANVQVFEGSNVYAKVAAIDHAEVTFMHASTLCNDIGSFDTALTNISYTCNLYVKNLDAMSIETSNISALNVGISNAYVEFMQCRTMSNDTASFTTTFTNTAYVKNLNGSNVCIVDMEVNNARMSNVEMLSMVASNASVGHLTVNKTLVSHESAVFDGVVTFSNNVYVQSPMFVNDFAKFTSNLQFTYETEVLGSNNFFQNFTGCNMLLDGEIDVLSTPRFNSNIIVQGAFLGPRIGIGPYGMALDESTLNYDPISLSNVEYLTTKTLSVEESAVFGVQNVTGSNLVVSVHGTLQANSVVNLSDKRLKTNIKCLDRSSVANGLYDVPVYQFDFKHTGEKNKIGVLAQDLESFLPNAIKTIPSYSINLEKRAMLCESGNPRVLVFEKQHTLEEGCNLFINIQDGVFEFIANRSVEKVIDDKSILLDSAIPLGAQRGRIVIVKVQYMDVKLVDNGYLLNALMIAVQELKKEIVDLKKHQAK